MVDQPPEPGIDTVATLRNLRRLRLNGTAVTDAGLEKLKTLTHLERLDLQACTRITDSAVATLAVFPALHLVDVTATHMTDQGIAALRRTAPQILVLHDADFNVGRGGGRRGQ